MWTICLAGKTKGKVISEYECIFQEYLRIRHILYIFIYNVKMYNKKLFFYFSLITIVNKHSRQTI